MSLRGDKIVAFAGFVLTVAAFHQLAKISSKKTESPKSPTTRKNGKSGLGNVKPVGKHLIVCGLGKPESWPANIEKDEDSFVGRLVKMIKDFQVPTTPTIKVTGCDLPNTMDGFHDVIVYPEKKIYRVREENMLSFCALVTDPASLTPRGTKWPKSIFHDYVPTFEKLVLVCCHASRDKRCGATGPAVLLSTRMHFSNEKYSNIVVAASSHIGGHEYAPTLVTYPEGDYFGRVTDSSIEKILSGCTDECYRGNGLLEW